jgi:hypothetical protein
VAILYVTFARVQLPVLLHFHSCMPIMAKWLCGSVPHASPVKFTGTAICDKVKCNCYIYIYIYIYI